ncbi:threonine--tRNA ligase [Candidatus Pacearchaeota archaeon]|nr:threonine--tRNA ligase [Candidatus Pacearchaeota archaeon]
MKQSSKKKEEKISDSEIKQLKDKLTKVKMSAPRGKNGLKSNVELGRDLDLYIVSEVVGSGLPLLTERGTTIKREIERFIVDEEIKRGYSHVSTPFMAKSDLYKISGHWQHYRDGMFVIDEGKEKFALRPMTCPFHFVLYKSKPRSYKELPIRYAEISTLFRNEKSGELRGLTRVRQMTLADAHIICMPKQIEEEFAKVLELIKFAAEKLGINDIYYRFSKWDSKDKRGKYVDNPKAWIATQKMMKKILDKLKLKYTEAENEAAYYGPKLDIQYKDVYGKEDTLFTIQIDFALPEKFDLSYMDERGKKQQAMVIHRSSTGTTERVIAHILELTQGNLKTWLSPIQVRILSFTDRNIPYAKKVIKQIGEAIPNARIDADFRNTPVQGKVKDAEMIKIPYIVVLGDREEKEKSLAVRIRENKKIENFTVDEFCIRLKKEIGERK